MLSPRDIYPPEWFTESSTDERAVSGKGKKKRPAPKYTVRQLVSGCRVLCMASTTERRKAPARHTRVAREVHHE